MLYWLSNRSWTDPHFGSGRAAATHRGQISLQLPPRPLKRVDYYYLHNQQLTEGEMLILPPIWRDERLLTEARDGFDSRSRGR